MAQGLIHLPPAKAITTLWQKPLRLLIPAYIILIYAGWSDYFPWQSPVSVFGLLMMPLLCKPAKTNTSGYLITSIILIALTFILPVKTFLYFSLVSGVLFFSATVLHAGGHLCLLAMIIVSPIFNYLVTVFTFPIRLQLTSLAAYMLSLINPAISNSGNIIHLNGNDFSVETECMGLNMVCMGLLCGLALLSYYQRNTQRTVSLIQSLLFLVLMMLLIVASNLFRIICLVHFNIPAGAFMHELTGAVCFILYVILPATFFIKWLIKKKENHVTKEYTQPLAAMTKYSTAKNTALLALLSVLTLFVCAKKNFNDPLKLTIPSVNNYTAEIASHDIIKLENKNSLIYIKPVKGFYSTEHSPMICWKGSGYIFSRIEEIKICNQALYMGELIKEKDTLYTAWWFDNGDYKTIRQLDWRWKVLRGAENFSIVNVTATTPAQLKKEVSAILLNNPFKKILTNK